MPLAPGTHLGPYEITGPLGSGGMGEVYRARDTRLERTVAIKILPTQFSSDSVRKQRFEREAKTISSLNHPYICVLYDVGHQDGTDYLVMECVEGETLARRLEKGPLPLDQALKYGAQIAGALQQAHRNGVVHRDLKPGNIMLAKSGVKLLDFGLAKPLSEAIASAQTVSVSPAKSRSLTADGAIIGTVQYMSPEQLEGKETDARSDLFSFGAVLYEMVTGNHAFEGKSQASVIAAILEHEPKSISAFQPMASHALDRLLRTCLAKDPEERIQTAHDVKLQLQWIAESGLQTGMTVGTPAERKPWDRISKPLAAVLLLLLFGGGTVWWKTSSKHPPAMYFHAAIPFAANDLALSPDGRTLAIAAYSGQGDNLLWTYEVGSRKTSALDGTQGASFPFWSPDGKSIGFFADGKLKKVDASGGQVQVLCDAPNGRGGTWNRDGVIVFTPDGLGTGLFRVSSSGGSPVQITKLDASRFEQSHRNPMFLPDGKHFIYLAANFGGKTEYNALFLGLLDSQDRRLLVSTSANAAYAEPGYLVYMRDNKTLVAQPFDRQRYVLSGESHPLSDDLLYFPQVFRAVFSVSGGEVLVTQTGKGGSLSQLTWFDRSGKPTGTVGKPGSYFNVRLSPDGRRVAADQTDPNLRGGDIWIYEPGRGGSTRLTFDPSSHVTPIWSPDGRQILFGSNRGVSSGALYLKNADGSGPEEELANTGADALLPNAWDWSRDGTYILFAKGNEPWFISQPERVAKPLLQAKWTMRNGEFSPDGRWMAYASNETGSMEIYVSPFPSLNGKWQVSSSGGQEPKWRQDGKELFYVSSDGKMMSVGVTTGASFKGSPPVALFQTHRRQPVSLPDVFSYDVTGDGQRFLILTKVDEANTAPLSVVLNWASEMEK